MNKVRVKITIISNSFKSSFFDHYKFKETRLFTSKISKPNIKDVVMVNDIGEKIDHINSIKTTDLSGSNKNILQARKVMKNYLTKVDGELTSQSTVSYSVLSPHQPDCSHLNLNKKLIYEREESALELLQTYCKQNLRYINEDEYDQRSSYHVTYVSGASGSGKSTFGSCAVELMRSIDSSLLSNQEIEFQQFLSSVIQIKIECNGGGDAFKSQIDENFSPDKRLHIRLFARALGLKFAYLVAMKDDELKILSSDLIYKSQFNLAKLLEYYISSNKDPPNVQSTLSALAIDYRKSKCLPPTAIVPFYILIDEHQLIYKYVFDILGESKAINAHKDFLYDLMTIQGSGDDSWCFENHVRVFPLFSGTNSECLKNLISPTLFKKKHIVLPGLSPNSSVNLVKYSINKKKLLNQVHDSWYIKHGKNLSPLEILCEEVGGNPRALVNFPMKTIKILQNDVSGPGFNSVKNIYKAAYFLQEPSQGYMSEHLLEAVLTGFPLSSFDLQQIQHDKFHEHCILVKHIMNPLFNSEPHAEDLRKVSFAPSKLASFHVTGAYGHIIEWLFTLLGENDLPKDFIQCFSDNFEQLVCERIMHSINLCNFLKIPINNRLLYGEMHFIVYKSNTALIKHKMKISNYVNDCPPFWENYNGNVNPVLVNSFNTLERMLNGEISNLKEQFIAWIGNFSHPSFDVVLWSKLDNRIQWISVKGAIFGIKETSKKTTQKTLSKNVLFKDIQRIHMLRTENTKSVNHIIVYLIAHKLSFDEKNYFSKIANKVIQNHKHAYGINSSKIESILLVDDMSDFSPTIAHHFSLVNKNSPYKLTP